MMNIGASSGSQAGSVSGAASQRCHPHGIISPFNTGVGNESRASHKQCSSGAENGEEHQYLGYSFKGILHRINFEASFFPSCPIELIPPERRKFGTWQDKEPWKR